MKNSGALQQITVFQKICVAKMISIYLRLGENQDEVLGSVPALKVFE